MTDRRSLSLQGDSTLSWFGGHRLTPLRIAVAYVAFGFALLLASDFLLPRLVAERGVLHDLQVAKGVAEVVVSAGLIYVLVASAQRELCLKERAMNEAPVGIAITDLSREDNPLVYVNEGFERVTGYSADECLGRNCRFLQGEESDPETVAEVRAAIDAERPVSVELLNYRKDGTPFWNRLDLVPVRSDGRTVTHYLGIQQDVTDRKEREQRLSVLNRLLRHNLRNKLNVVLGRLDDVAAEPHDSDEHVAAIREAAEDLLRLGDQVRRFDAIVAADGELLETVDLRDLVAETVADLRDGRDAAVDLRTPGPEDSSAEPLPARIHSVFGAALREVISTLAEGGDRPVAVTVRSEGNRAVVELRDEGGALSDQAIDVVRRGTETPLEHLRGLELWLARWAVEKSQGEFVVELDDGTPVVRLSLRVVADDGVPSERPAEV